MSQAARVQLCNRAPQSDQGIVCDIAEFHGHRGSSVCAQRDDGDSLVGFPRRQHILHGDTSACGIDGHQCLVLNLVQPAAGEAWSRVAVPDRAPPPRYELCITCVSTVDTNDHCIAVTGRPVEPAHSPALEIRDLEIRKRDAQLLHSGQYIRSWREPSCGAEDQEDSVRSHQPNAKATEGVDRESISERDCNHEQQQNDEPTQPSERKYQIRSSDDQDCGYQRDPSHGKEGPLGTTKLRDKDRP